MRNRIDVNLARERESDFSIRGSVIAKTGRENDECRRRESEERKRERERGRVSMSEKQAFFLQC